jgi:hypothetical protein
MTPLHTVRMRFGPHGPLRPTQALITQTSPTAVSNRCQSLDQQVCRGLMASRGRLLGDDS